MRRKNILALLLALLLTVGQITPALAADTAAVMKLSATEGTVTVCNASARTLTVKDDMRLYNGYTVETAAKSYAWINLDDSKLVKLDASTKVEIRKSGKKLEVLVNSGNIYGDVSKKLDSDETLNIRTSTAVVGIRGTKFQVGVYAGTADSGSGQSSGSGTVSNGQTVVTCIEGSVSLTTPEPGGAPGTADPGTGEPSPGAETSATQTVIVSAGQTATVSATSNGTESTTADISVSLESMQQSDLTGSTQVELTSQGDYTLTPPNGETITLTAASAAAQKAADQRAAQQQATENARPAQSQTPAQSGASQEVTNPVWDSSSGSSNSSTGSSGGGSSSSGSTGSSSGGSSSSGGTGSSGNGSSSSGSSGSGSTAPSQPSSPTPSTPETPSVTKYTVTFNANGGTGGSSQTVEENKLPSTPSRPVREGYDFTGWYTDSNCTNNYSFNTPVTGNITVYAGWKLKEYSILYVGNGGNFDGTSPTITILTEHGKPLSTPPVPVMDGYSFDGWYTDSSCTTAYDLTAAVTSDLTLYAKWTETASSVTCTVTFVSNGGSDVTSQTVALEGMVTKPDAPTWNYHSFVGWYTDSECTNVYDFSTPVTSDFTLYAKWRDGVAINFDPNDGITEPYTLLTGLDGRLSDSFPDLPEREDYLCTGWYMGLEEDALLATGNSVFEAPATLYAHWAKPYTVTFDSNSGSAVEAQTVIEGGKAAKPADPTRDGYTFDSWYQDAACSYSEEWDFDESTVDNNITLYAKWFGHDEILSLSSSDEANLDMLDRLMKADACKTIDLLADGSNMKLALGNQDLQIPDDKTLIVHADVVISGHITANGTLAMLGGEIYSGVAVEDGGILRISSGIIDSGVTISEGGYLDMSGGTLCSNTTPALTVNGPEPAKDPDNGSDKFETASAKITGGEIQGGSTYAIYFASHARIETENMTEHITATKVQNIIGGVEDQYWEVERSDGPLVSNIPDTTYEVCRGYVSSSNRYYLDNRYEYINTLEYGGGEFVVLLEDCTINATTSNGNPYTVDLNGKTLEVGTFGLKLGGDIVLTDNSTGTKGKLVINTGSNFAFNGGTLKAADREFFDISEVTDDFEVVENTSSGYWELQAK